MIERLAAVALALLPGIAGGQVFQAMQSGLPAGAEANIAALRPPGLVLGISRRTDDLPVLEKLFAESAARPVVFKPAPHVTVTARNARAEVLRSEGAERALGWFAPARLDIADRSGVVRTVEGLLSLVFSRGQQWGRIDSPDGVLIMGPVSAQIQYSWQVNPQRFVPDHAGPAAHKPVTGSPAVSIRSPFRACRIDPLELYVGTQLNLGMIYTPAALEKARSSFPQVVEEPCPMIQSIVAWLNLGLQYSGVRVRFSLVGIGRAEGYTEPESGGARSVSGTLAHLRDESGGLGKAAREWRGRRQADVLVLLAAVDDACGEADGRFEEWRDPKRALAVTDVVCAYANSSAAHEIGHILGLRHDRGADAGTKPFSYGHGFVHKGKISIMTVMGSRISCPNCTRYNLWSNPAIVEPNAGIKLGDPYHEHEARVIEEVAPEVAKFRDRL